MPRNPTPGHEPDAALSDESFDQALLCLLVDDPLGLWSLAELDRSLTPSCESRSGDEPSGYATEDAVQRLYAAGMLHRLGRYVFASRAAHAVHRLAS